MLSARKRYTYGYHEETRPSSNTIQLDPTLAANTQSSLHPPSNRRSGLILPIGIVIDPDETRCEKVPLNGARCRAFASAGLATCEDVGDGHEESNNALLSVHISLALVACFLGWTYVDNGFDDCDNAIHDGHEAASDCVDNAVEL
jgi:hypothetical protein